MATQRARVTLPRWRWGEPVEPLRRLLADGGLLAIPTESSYGLAADPASREGIEAIYRVKRRERGKPLPVVAGVEQLTALGISPDLPQLAALEELWPAPLTAVLPLSRPLAAAAGGTTLAVRVPAHTLLRRLLADLKCGLTATSANRAGEPPVVDPRELDELLADLVDRTVVVDGGLLPGGPPSTLIAWRDGELRILRQGAFQAQGLKRVGKTPAAGNLREMSIATR